MHAYAHALIWPWPWEKCPYQALPIYITKMNFPFEFNGLDLLTKYWQYPEALQLYDREADSSINIMLALARAVHVVYIVCVWSWARARSIYIYRDRYSKKLYRRHCWCVYAFLYLWCVPPANQMIFCPRFVEPSSPACHWPLSNILPCHWQPAHIFWKRSTPSVTHINIFAHAHAYAHSSHPIRISIQLQTIATYTYCSCYVKINIIYY
jgi:hypothetical protein